MNLIIIFSVFLHLLPAYRWTLQRTGRGLLSTNCGISFQSQGREQLTGHRQEVFNFSRITQAEPLYILTVPIQYTVELHLYGLIGTA
jgi:hypothetical protein